VAASGNLLKLAVVELLEIESLSAGALQNQPSKKANRIMRRSYSARIYLSVAICLAANHAVLVKAQSETLRLPPKQAEQTIAGRARQVLLFLKSRNVARLSALVHPRKGLRFSPYHSVNLVKGGDRVFTRSQVKSLLADKKRYLWGEEDGSGDPIRLTFAGYHRKFVYDHDYLRARDVTYNSDKLSSGNLINNIRESYPAAIIVEYHFPGFQEKYGGMDWTSLWLVFEKQGSEWYLVGLVHGEWTI
jgi:hypothetical protein